MSNDLEGLGMNTMLRNVGGAIGPVLATTIMTTYTVKNISYSIPSSYAFNLIFIIGIVLMLAIAVMSLFVRNYTFRNTSASQ
jgi:hypothetical protein